MNQELEIIEELKGSNPSDGLRRIYHLYFQAVVAQVIAEGGTEEDGADIFQESVVILLTKIRTNQFRGESRLATFLHAIARNRWLFACRTEKRRKEREKNYQGDAETQIRPAVWNENADGYDTGKLVGQLLAELGEVCKKLLRGFYYEKKKMKELLEAFDFENEQVLRNRKSKCMKKLREILKEKPELNQQLQSSFSNE